MGSSCEWVGVCKWFFFFFEIDLLSCSCPYQDDHYLTTLIPVDESSGLQFPTHYKRFILKMLTFVEPTTFAPLKETVLLTLQTFLYLACLGLKHVLYQVFIHCSTSVCTPTATESCVQRCNRRSECSLYLIVCGVPEPLSDFSVSYRKRC